MIKREELTNPNSCMSRAHDDEMIFVLLGRDAAAPAAIRAWVEKRIEMGKNIPNDQQILDAMECAAAMADYEFGISPKGPTLHIIKAIGLSLRYKTWVILRSDGSVILEKQREGYIPPVTRVELCARCADEAAAKAEPEQTHCLKYGMHQT